MKFEKEVIPWSEMKKNLLEKLFFILKKKRNNLDSMFNSRMQPTIELVKIPIKFEIIDQIRSTGIQPKLWIPKLNKITNEKK